MRKQAVSRRLTALLLAVTMLAAILPSAYAQETQRQELSFAASSAAMPDPRLPAAVEAEETEMLYALDEVVRVSIVLKDDSTLDRGFSTYNIAGNTSAMAYRNQLRAKQALVTDRIEKRVLGGEALDVVWNLTLAANIISANVEYGQIQKIRALDGVADVVLETVYTPDVVDTGSTADPNMSTSSSMIGSAVAYANGYTGAGSRIAVIDTGIDTDHQSFDDGAFAYSLSELGIDVTLLDKDDIESVLPQLNIADTGVTAEQLYVSSKIPFGYNYVDKNLIIDHDHDKQGEHGSHVTGIAAANSWIPTENGFEPALSTVVTQGVAPDAQIITMKVFGSHGGAYDSDYMAAIEDAIILGADAVNLSLGAPYAGFSYNSTYADILSRLTEKDAVVTMSMGNSGSWAANSDYVNALFADDVNFHTGGSPGSYTNALTVASVDNAGATGAYLTVGDKYVFYTESLYRNAPFVSIPGEYSYIYIDSVGTEAEFAAVAAELAGKIAICNRGEIAFADKANAAVRNGAAAVLIVNTEDSAAGMDLSNYIYDKPVASIRLSEGKLFKENKTDAGYYTGTVTVGSSVGSAVYGGGYTMSSFSSWGVPGSLELKPEITAPGGSIYSVNGLEPGGKGYEVMSGTSMASPQVAGMVAVLAQYLDDTKIKADGFTRRALAQSLLMSTAEPVWDNGSDSYYSVLKQGAGLTNVGSAVLAQSYIRMGSDATASYADGKVKAELGDDPRRDGKYSYTFTINNFSGAENSYTLTTDLFTQALFEANGYTWLDTATTPLAADVTYLVDGQAFVPTASVQADVNRDGRTDANDAQALLDYIVGVRGEDGLDLSAGDLDGDGKNTTYDAYLILAGLGAQVTVPANGKLEVEVDITLTDGSLRDYPNGAYVEGYTFVRALASEEGLLDVTHSIPILGFYGSWTDPSMYDRASVYDFFKSRAYGLPNQISYTGEYSNTLTYVNSETGETEWLLGNPYVVEKEYPEGKAALRSADLLNDYRFSLIRNAATLALYITDEAGEPLYISLTTEDDMNYAAFYYETTGDWLFTEAAYPIGKSVGEIAGEHETLNITLAAVPEYYGAVLTEEDVKALIKSDALGDGAYLTTTVNVDDEAPALLHVYRDSENETLEIVAKDNRNIAYIAVTNRSGAIVYADGVPEGKAGEEIHYTLDVSNARIGEYCGIFIGDYAGNAIFDVVEYGGEVDNGAGKMYAARDIDGSSYLTEIDAEHVWYDSQNNAEGGLAAVNAFVDVNGAHVSVRAAEYADGYIFYMGYDGILYAASQSETDYVNEVANLGAQGLSNVQDFAFNYSDGMLYALGGGSTLWRINPLNGVTRQVATISAGWFGVTTMTIDDDGTFYSVDDTYVYSWTLPENAGDEILEISAKTAFLSYKPLTFEWFTSIAWDHDNDVLYAAGSRLWVIDPQSGSATRANKDDSNSRASYIPTVNGLYIVPGEVGDSQFQPSETVEDILLSASELELYPGNRVTLAATLLPWTLKNKAVTWNSSDTDVVTVYGGTVTAVGQGSATITASAAADPSKTATCSVTVLPLASIDMNGLIWDTDAAAKWAAFDTSDTENWTALAVSDKNYYAGTLSGDVLYVHDGETLYAVDADTYEVIKKIGSYAFDTDLGTGDLSIGIFSDAAAVPVSDGVPDLGSPLLAPSCFGAMIAPVHFDDLDMKSEDSRAWSLINELGGYTTGSPVVGLTYLGTDTYLDYGPSLYYVGITEAGLLYQFVIYNDDGVPQLRPAPIGETGVETYGASYGTAGNFGVSASLAYDEETGYLIYSTYTGGDAAQLHMFDIGENYEITTMTSPGFGKDVWPVAVLYQRETSKMQAPGWCREIAEASVLDVLQKVEAGALKTDGTLAGALASVDADHAGKGFEPVAGGLNAIVTTGKSPAQPMSDTTVTDEEDTVILDVTAKDASGADVASTNGKLTVTYDSGIFTLKSVTVHASYKSYNDIKTDGKVVIAYAGLNTIPAGTSVATLVLERKANGAGSVSVLHEQVNDQNPNYNEIVPINYSENPDDHSETIVVGAKEPTWTEPGYTGDVVCAKCGTVLKKGIVIPAKGTIIGVIGGSAPSVTKPTAPMPFTDVNVGDWFYNDVKYVYENGLMNGTSDTKFSPYSTLTRAMVVTVLYRMEGEPAARYNGTFPDVTDGQWYTSAVEWAAKNEIVTGYTTGKFGPNDAVTREQLAAILYRYAGCKGYDVTGSDSLSGCTDSASISAYAVSAAKWAVDGDMLLVTDSKLRPREAANRAEVAAAMASFYAAYVE